MCFRTMEELLKMCPQLGQAKEAIMAESQFNFLATSASNQTSSTIATTPQQSQCKSHDPKVLSHFAERINELLPVMYSHKSPSDVLKFISYR